MRALMVLRRARGMLALLRLVVSAVRSILGVLLLGDLSGDVW